MFKFEEIAYVRKGVRKLQLALLRNVLRKLTTDARTVVSLVKKVVRELWTYLKRTMLQAERFHRVKYGKPVQRLNLTRKQVKPQVTCRKPNLIRKIIR